ncbi:maltase A3 [Lepeophtheirus salmonis]|uniref:maltase A3 n=1 Tax=Lepeophtheirus salmonis TaxID=72036 RepID=UPI001AE1936F|nr:maltase A3-like [Lepeophtheirus salmonis]
MSKAENGGGMAPNEVDSLTGNEGNDPMKVKFVGRSEDVEKGRRAQNENKFKPLSKEELAEYAKDPFWSKIRWLLFILFWTVWAGMLVVSIIIIVLTPKCPTPKPKEWWQKAPIYEVYAKSFKDSDGDGLGDLKGVTSKLDYLASLGVGSVWLSPVYKSPMDDNGYDIADFESIDPTFGSMEDFKELVAEMKKRGLKLIMDLVPNHSSDQHPWFQKSIEKDGEYTDYYVWRAGDSSTPPNNWLSVFGGSAWSFDERRGEWYLHQFKKSQPDLNLRNPLVIERLKEVMKFWLNLGVDGYRFDSVAHMFESEDFADEPANDASNSDDETAYSSLLHTKTYEQPENLDLLAVFREVLDEKTAEDETSPRIMMTEAYTDDLNKYYGPNGTISHMPINFNLITAFKDKSTVSAKALHNAIIPYIAEVKEVNHTWPNFNLGNHDNPRVRSRFGPELIDGINMLVMLLPGTPITYYGEELGMEDLLEVQNDPRDPERSPMIWNDQENAGFTNGTPWLKITDNYKSLNAEVQMNDPLSHFSNYKVLAKLRMNDAVLLGSFDPVLEGDVFGYSRIKKGNPGLVVLVNFGEDNALVDLHERKFFPDYGTISIVSQKGSNLTQEENVYSPGNRVYFNDVKLGPKEGIVISFVAKFV